LKQHSLRQSRSRSQFALANFASSFNIRFRLSRVGAYNLTWGPKSWFSCCFQSLNSSILIYFIVFCGTLFYFAVQIAFKWC
jgi:hypothetical protein